MRILLLAITLQLFIALDLLSTANGITKPELRCQCDRPCNLGDSFRMDILSINSYRRRRSISEDDLPRRYRHSRSRRRHHRRRHRSHRRRSRRQRREVDKQDDPYFVKIDNIPVGKLAEKLRADKNKEKPEILHDMTTDMPEKITEDVTPPEPDFEPDDVTPPEPDLKPDVIPPEPDLKPDVIHPEPDLKPDVIPSKPDFKPDESPDRYDPGKFLSELRTSQVVKRYWEDVMINKNRTDKLVLPCKGHDLCRCEASSYEVEVKPNSDE